MIADREERLGPSRTRLFLDTNLLVLLIVGSVNPDRIATFKRTRRYSPEDYELLVEYVEQFHVLLTLPHVLAEVSNLTDLPGDELFLARALLAQRIEEMDEQTLASAEATGVGSLARLGLTDSAIVALMQRVKCTVMTDDYGLYSVLAVAGVEVENFMHLRAGARP